MDVRFSDNGGLPTETGQRKAITIRTSKRGTLNLRICDAIVPGLSRHRVSTQYRNNTESPKALSKALIPSKPRKK